VAKLYSCDKCGASISGPLRVKIVFERTPEEIQQLMAAQNMPLGTEHIVKQASLVQKNLDLCHKCYGKFKKDWYEG
jgi:hypothetical protein